MSSGVPVAGVGERYRAGDFVSYPAGPQYALRQSALSGSAALLTTRQAALLAGCTPFRTLDGHAEANAASRTELEALVRQGLLISEAAIREWCMRGPRPSEAPPSISTLAVITRDRIATLRRCLESFIAEGHRTGRRVEYLVVDNAQQVETREMTRATLRTLAATRAVTVRYAGLEEKQRFANALCDSGLRRSEVDFALFDPEGCDAMYGAARNAVLLATLGRMALLADDDTVATVAPVPGATPGGMALSSENDPTAMWFFPDQGRAMRAGASVDQDTFGLHEALLGRDVASCLDLPADLVRVDEMAGGLLQAVQSGRARIAATATGMHGDAGGGMPPAVRLLDAASRARLTESDGNYRSLGRSRYIQRGVTAPTISNGPYFMTIGAALDNRGILPPFFPVFRGEDTIYGFMLGVCLEGACIGHLPFTVLHNPAEARDIPPDAISRFAAHPTSFDLVIACIQSFSPPPGADAVQRLHGLGRHVSDIASLAPPDFEEFLRLWVWRIKALVLARHTHELEASTTASAAWTQDVQHYLERMRSSLVADGYLVPPELETRFGEDGLRVMQRLVARFGALLACWPAMLEVARSLAANGQELAPALDAG